MISIFRDALDSTYTIYTAGPIVLGYDEYEEETGAEKEIFCTELILRKKDGTDIILGMHSACKVVTIPAYDLNTKQGYIKTDAIDLSYVKHGYRHAVQIETETLYDTEDIEAFQLFQNRKDGIHIVEFTGEMIPLYDSYQAAKIDDEGALKRSTVFITKNIVLETKDEQ